MDTADQFPLSLSYDDVLLVPQYSEVLPSQVKVCGQVSKNISLRIPIASSAMDTVTEAEMAIAMAQIGGIGIVHKNLSIQDQAAQIEQVKKAEPSDQAATDGSHRLITGAAVGVGSDTPERAKALLQAGVNVIVVDTAHGHSKGVLETVRHLKSTYSRSYKFDIVAGNIATSLAAFALIEAGVDGIKVGIGPGSICTTRIVTGVGVPQLSAILDCAKPAKEYGIPLIADGGIKYSGDCAKALAAGASCIMIGSLLAGTEESPGELIMYQGQSYKIYRGMGSLGAMKRGSKDRYFQGQIEDHNKLVPEGIEGRVVYKGPVANVIYQLIGGVRSSMGYVGAKDLKDFQERAVFTRMTAAGLKESHVHNVFMVQEAPNYA